MGVGVALEVSLGKSGRPSWSWCFLLWALEVFCAEELAFRGQRWEWLCHLEVRCAWLGRREVRAAPVVEEGPGSELGRAGA